MEAFPSAVCDCVCIPYHLKSSRLKSGRAALCAGRGSRRKDLGSG